LTLRPFSAALAVNCHPLANPLSFIVFYGLPVTQCESGVSDVKIDTPEIVVMRRRVFRLALAGCRRCSVIEPRYLPSFFTISRYLPLFATEL